MSTQTNIQTASIGDAVTRKHGLTVRHDVRDENRKAQRGWMGLQLREDFPRPGGKPASGASENPPEDASPDGADGVFPVGPANIIEEYAAAEAREQLNREAFDTGGTEV